MVIPISGIPAVPPLSAIHSATSANGPSRSTWGVMDGLSGGTKKVSVGGAAAGSINTDSQNKTSLTGAVGVHQESFVASGKVRRGIADGGAGPASS